VRAGAGKPAAYVAARGDGGATLRGKERASAGRVSGGCGAGGARGAEKSGAGQLGLRKVASEGGGVTGTRQSRRDWRLTKEDWFGIFQKCRDSTIKPN
jgi:hypothetical protein